MLSMPSKYNIFAVKSRFIKLPQTLKHLSIGNKWFHINKKEECTPDLLQTRTRGYCRKECQANIALNIQYVDRHRPLKFISSDKKYYLLQEGLLKVFQRIIQQRVFVFFHYSKGKMWLSTAKRHNHDVVLKLWTPSGRQ